jgi:cyclase
MSFEFRVIPALLVYRGGLYKTTRFAEPRYIGDPVNAVWIFNEKRVDEIAILDIEASMQGRAPDLGFIREFASECFIPVCYGGGISSVADMERILAIGVEKVSVNKAFFENEKLVTDAARRFGAQTVVVSIDVKTRRDGTSGVFTQRGTKDTGLSPVEAARRAADAGAGEIVLQSIDREGTMSGFDRDLVRSVSSAVPVPVIASGGAKDIDDIADVLVDGGASGAMVGSLFVYYGRLRGVLINVPDEQAREAAIARAHARKAQTAGVSA